MAQLNKEEYVEQVHLFRAMHQRLSPHQPIQEVLYQLRQEILVTTNLPRAIDFLLAELNHAGQMGPAMARLSHYFSSFQAFLVQNAEKDTGRFDMQMAALILEHDARLRSTAAPPVTQFFFQFECLCRNHLSYDHGLAAMSLDPVYDKAWAAWILQIRHRLGIVDLSDLIYVHSQHYANELQRRGQSVEQGQAILFGESEGRIALANRGREMLMMFSALQRQLGYPPAPRRERTHSAEESLEKLQRLLGRLEVRVKLLEEEQREKGIDLTKFYGKSLPPEA